MINVIWVQKTCEACPAQWEGLTDDDREVYVRYRWGWLSVLVGNPTIDFSKCEQEVFAKKLGDEYDGCLDYDELRAATVGSIKWP